MKRLDAALAMVMAGALITAAGNANARERSAAAFVPRGMGAQDIESRSIEAGDRDAVLRASLGVLQDLHFVAVSVDAQTGTVVAVPPANTLDPLPPFTFTVTVMPEPGAAGRFVLRSSIEGGMKRRDNPADGSRCLGERATVSRDFHARLLSALRREEPMP